MARKEIAGSIGFRDELHDSLVARARELRPLLARNAAEHEARGELTPEVVAALTQAEMFKMSAPRRWGGLCVSCATMREVTAELARGCPSTSWVVSIITNNVWTASTLSDSLQKLVFHDGIPIICGPQNGAGRVERRGSSFVVNGRWSYGSGSHHSSWAIMPAAFDNGDKCMIAAPMTELRIEPSWDVAGMKGNGSDTVVAEEVVLDTVQIHLVMPPEAQPASEFEREACDHWIAFPLLRAKALGVLLGIAEGLFEAVAAGSERPIIYSAYERRGDSAVWQSGLGQTAAMIGVARAVIEKQCDLIDDAARQGQSLSYAQRARLRGEGSHASSLLIDAVEKLMSLGGSAAYSSTNPMQRFWRDFSIGMRHVVFNIELGYEVFGRQLLGLDPKVVIPDFV